MREGDLVRFNALARRGAPAGSSWPHDYRSDLPLVLGEGRTVITHLRFLEPLEVGA